MSTVHIISENELQGLKKSGKRMRAKCPIHNSRDLDLSINPYSEDGYLDEEEARLAGYGFCHGGNCNAVILVQEWNPQAAANILGCSAEDFGSPKHKVTARDLEKAEDWQRRELAALNKISPVMLQRLQEHPRALAYLEQRGLSQHLDLLASLEVGYIPPANEWSKLPPFELRAWCDRIVFPFTTAEGERGYVGRTLQLWQTGMDENEHKKALEAHNKRIEEEHGKEEAHKYQIRRWRKTYRSGFFNKQAMQGQDRAIICEGPFDAIPLIAAGLAGVIAVAGTTFDATGIPTDSVFDVTLAYDADMEGKAALARTKELLGAAGVIPMFCPAPGDGMGKDWSERYRLHGLDGLAPLLGCDPLSPAYVPGEVETTPPDLVSDSPAAEDDGQLQYEQDLANEFDLCATCVDMGLEVRALDCQASDGFMYCAAHHPEPPRGKRITYLDDGLLPLVRMFEGYSSKAYMQFIVAEKLEEIKQANKERMRQMISCQGMIALNKSGQPAHAFDQIERYRQCGSTKLIWLSKLEKYVCMECQTPQEIEGMRQVRRRKQKAALALVSSESGGDQLEKTAK